MKETKRWQTFTAIAATGALAFGLALYAAPPSGESSSKSAKPTAAVGTPSGAVRVIAGPENVDHDSLPIWTPVKVDYRKSDPSLSEGQPVTRSVWEALGGPVGARTGEGDPCQITEQCANCNVCEDYRCEGVKCVIDILDGVTDDGCDDGLYCNGEELCSAGSCTDGTPPDCAAESQVCDEGEDACVDPCTVDADCDDGLECTDDECDTETGVCSHTPNCGPNSTCLEPFEGDPKTCIPGRCCAAEEACTREEYADCLAVPGQWLAVGGTTTTCADLESRCPNYGGGIFADTTLSAVVGPFSNLTCDSLIRVGDDYQSSLHGTGPDAPNDNYMQLELMRWVGGVFPGLNARWSVELRDENGILIENVFYPDGVNDGGDLGIRTVNFDPAIVVPTKGIVSFSVQGNFGLDGRLYVGMTDATDVGTNNGASMYFETPARTAQIGNYLGRCTGPTSEGQYCDPGQGNDDCAGGAETCVDVPDIMSFELVGTRTTAPSGACCDAETGDCTQELPWVCEANGGSFQGEGTLCGICEDGITPCDQIPDDPDCAVECFPIPACATQGCCADNGDCVATTAPTCTGTVCDNEPTIIGCTLDAECPEGGTCVTVTGTSQGFGTDCDPNCCEQPATSYKGVDNCGLGTPQIINVPALGDPSAPWQYTFTGNNSAATYDDFDFVCIGGPFDGNACEGDLDCGDCTAGQSPGTPCAVDSDCDTSPGAGDGTCDAGDCDQWCDSTIFDPDDSTKDPGWWQVFSLTACAEVRFDLCCTDANGDALRPQWSNVYSECPCDEIIAQTGVDPPIGIGRGTDGFARGGPFCDDDNLWETFRLRPGIYYKPIYSAPGGTAAVPPGTDYQVHITVAACPVAACCVGSDWSITDELECEDLGGYWLNGNVDVPTQPDCSQGGADSPCCTGSCCLGPGQCEDDVEGAPLEPADCVLLDGEFVGGATCAGDPGNFLPEPCPTCPIGDEGNCLDNDGDYIYPSDAEQGVRRAEDFVAQSGTISEVCVSGAYTDALENCNPPTGTNWCDCSCQGITTPEELDENADDCNPVVVDDFEVCVYADAGASPNPGESSYPGALVACSDTTSVRSVDVIFGNFAEWETSLVLTNPIMGLSQGSVYWISVVNDTSAPAGNTCEWSWTESAAGNDWSVFDFDENWTIADGRTTDHAICIDQGMEQPQPATGACCVCEPLGDCVNGRTRGECIELLGAWKQGEVCGPGICPQSRPLGDDCDPDAQVISDGFVAFTNECSITDGPDTVTNCQVSSPSDIDESEFGGDVWYFYTATCTGRLTVSMCEDADYDAILAIYTDGSDTCSCPTGTEQPPDPTFCADDTCGATGGPPVIEAIVSNGTCYTIRVAGWSGSQGSGSFTVECEAVSCTLSAAPSGDFSPVPADAGLGAKNRYITFTGGTPGRSEAVRVIFDSVPGYEYAENREMWVQEPVETTEASGSDGPPGVGEGSMWAATLGCNPFYTDWSVYDRVDVYNAAVVPGASYILQMIDDTCPTGNELNYSDAIAVNMSAAGDAVGSSCAPPPCNAPQGVIDFTDIGQVVDKFKNEPAAPRKARADLVNSNILFAPPDRKIDFVDISYDVDCFRGSCPALPGPPVDDPCAP